MVFCISSGRLVKSRPNDSDSSAAVLRRPGWASYSGGQQNHCPALPSSSDSSQLPSTCLRVPRVIGALTTVGVDLALSDSVQTNCADDAACILFQTWRRPAPRSRPSCSATRSMRGWPPCASPGRGTCTHVLKMRTRSGPGSRSVSALTWARAALFRAFCKYAILKTHSAVMPASWPYRPLGYQCGARMESHAPRDPAFAPCTWKETNCCARTKPHYKRIFVVDLK